jgi:CRP/FNR family transcriptional regulator, nitrogen oxide reductase regulator
MGLAAISNIGFASEEKTRQLHLVSPGISERVTPNSDFPNVLRRRATFVQRFEAFADIPLADCIEVVAHSQERQFVRRHTVQLGDPLRHVVLLLTGCLKVTQVCANGQEVILRLNGPGDLLGGAGVYVTSGHSTSARAVQTSLALVWETSRFEAVMERYPVFRRNIAHVLERHLNELEVRFREISTEKVAARLGSLLARLVGQVGKQADGHVEIALSRRELAQLTGTTLFTVSRLLCEWETQGIVSARREAVLVQNVPALLELSREE